MNHLRTLKLLAPAFAALVAISTAFADDGHNHGNESPAAAATASPRMEAHSGLFELVGVVDKGQMTIYLDRFATNEPVAGAKIEFESGTHKGVAAPQPDGTYLVKLDALAKPGALPFSFTVTAGAQTDLLAGELEMNDPHDHPAPAPATPWMRWAGYAVAALAALGAIAWLARRRAARRAAVSFSAIVAASCLWSVPDAWAGEGHDHGDSAPAASSNAPRRLPDGSVFLPKTSQRQLAVRTVLTEEKALPQSVELTGRVLMDANAGGRVQPTQPGRIEAGARGLPQLGQAVRKGEVLALVRASASAIERANQQAQAAELSAQLEQARRRADRLGQLEGTVPQKDIEAAQADVRSLQQRAAAIGRSVSATETLVAPVGGVISAANVVAGQVVDAREVLFEIVDPARLVVQAQAFDVALLGNIASASAVASAGTSVPLRFMGAGRAQREGAIPLQFRTEGTQAVALAVNQPVRVVVHTRAMVKGVPVPVAAVMKNAGNQDTVWVHTGAENFAARTVRLTPLDGATVSVVDGLKAGERVVVQGAALVNQVR